MTSLRIVRTGLLPRQFVRSAEDAYHVLRPLAQGLDREYFWRLDLDSRDRLLGCELVSIGTLTASFAEPREVFKGALLSNACKVIVAHSHPSGDSRPSQADRRATGQLILAGCLLQVDLVDHLILADDDYFSFKKARLI
ncbi:MAG: JAB domain-containing protein [Elusimicrobia bacterium]|nr:JAB domain-containing protein [Elusimicrobiota bacterium]